MFVGDFDKYDLFSEGIVEGVHIDEVNGGAIVVVDFGYFEVAWVRHIVPDVKSDFLLLIYRCMKASLTSSRILALTSELYLSIFLL